MSSGGYDPCECVWSHENAMRRLINLVSIVAILFLIKSFGLVHRNRNEKIWNVILSFARINNSYFICTCFVFQFHSNSKNKILI